MTTTITLGPIVATPPGRLTWHSPSHSNLLGRPMVKVIRLDYEQSPSSTALTEAMATLAAATWPTLDAGVLAELRAPTGASAMSCVAWRDYRLPHQVTAHYDGRPDPALAAKQAAAYAEADCGSQAAKQATLPPRVVLKVQVFATEIVEHAACPHVGCLVRDIAVLDDPAARTGDLAAATAAVDALEQAVPAWTAARKKAGRLANRKRYSRLPEAFRLTHLLDSRDIEARALRSPPLAAWRALGRRLHPAGYGTDSSMLGRAQRAVTGGSPEQQQVRDTVNAVVAGLREAAMK